MDETPLPRPAARALLLDQHQRLLLFAVREWKPGVTLWMPPGGGVEQGESYEAAARREVWEETGLAECEVGPWVWSRNFVLNWQGRVWEQRERFFLVRCETFEPSRENLEAHELSFINDYRWWHLDEVLASEDFFVPRRLAALLPPLLAGKLPPAPLDVTA